MSNNQVCLECFGEELVENHGEDIISICPECRQWEGKTVYLDDDEIEIWDKLTREEREDWIKQRGTVLSEVNK